jgi:lipoate-protein ligase A
MSTPWRLLVHPAACGAWNMSVDEALLISLQQDLALATLRFYRWIRPTVSLGYFQSASEVNCEAVRRLGFEMVRRPTGGRAILHDDELTYSVVFPADAIPGGRSVGRSYLSISAALVAGLELLGLPASVGMSKTSRSALSPGCFALSTRADLTVAGYKVIGSAQTRRSGFVLQHGSIPVTLNRDKHEAVFGRQEAEAVLSSAHGIADLLGARPSWEELIAAFTQGFQQALGVRIEQGEMAHDETLCAARLQAEKYGTESFTMRLPQDSSFSKTPDG